MKETGMKQFFPLFKNQHLVYKTITIILIGVSILFLYRIGHNAIVGLDYPNELLEPANVNLTNTLLNGNIPYDPENIVPYGEEPPINYEYPFLNSMFAAAFSYLTGGNTVAAHYLVTFLALLFTAFFLKNSKTTVGAAMGFLLLMFCHWRYGYINASPDSLGLFITIFTLYQACRPYSKHRPFICALGTVAAFYSKQYFAGICISIFIFMWLYSKKEALKYFVYCVVLLGASVILINAFWPLYWEYSVLCLFHGCFHGWGADGFMHLLDQFKYLGFIFAGLIAVGIFAIVQSYCNKKKISAEESNDLVKAEKKQLVTEGNALALFIIQIPVQILVLVFVGRNDGADLTYFLQLLIPSLVIVSLILMERIEFKKMKWMYACGYAGLALFTVYFGWNKLPMHELNAEDIANWERAYALMDEYQDDGDIQHTQETAYYAISRGDSVFLTGHDGDIAEWSYDDWKSNEMQQTLFPNFGKICEENLSYRSVIVDRIKNREMALVAVREGSGSFITADNLIISGLVPRIVITFNFSAILKLLIFQ